MDLSNQSVVAAGPRALSNLPASLCQGGMLAVEPRHMHLSSLPAVAPVPMCVREVEGAGLVEVEAVEAVEAVNCSDKSLLCESAPLEAKTAEVEWKGHRRVFVVVVAAVLVVVVVAVAVETIRPENNRLYMGGTHSQ